MTLKTQIGTHRGVVIISQLIQPVETDNLDQRPCRCVGHLIPILHQTVAGGYKPNILKENAYIVYIGSQLKILCEHALFRMKLWNGEILI